MSNKNVNQAAVRRSMLKNKSMPESLSILDAVCSTGAQCAEVKSSPIAQPALTALEDAVKTALDTYQVAVVALANGNASLISKAGLQSRNKRTPPAALEKVTGVVSKPGDNPEEAIISWPAAAGAGAYAPEVNYTPLDPNGAWTSLTPGTSRRRVVKAPQTGGQFLVRVAALGNGDKQSAWSDPILATAR